MTTTGATISAESTSRFVQTPRFRIHYHDVGQGRPIVLLHGSGPGATGWSNFQTNIEPLSRTHRVIAVDMPGWGESDTQTVETGFDHPQTLVDLLDVLGIEKAALVGNSMGGMTSISTAIRFPERVSHLVTMGAPCPGTDMFGPGGAPTEGLKILLRCYADPTTENFLQLVRVMCFNQALATERLAAERARVAAAHPEHLRSWQVQAQHPEMSAMAGFFELGPRVREITAPTMAMHGRDDRTVPFENSLRLTSTVVDSRMVLFNRCGHWAQLEHADELNRLVAQFVETR